MTHTVFMYEMNWWNNLLVNLPGILFIKLRALHYKIKKFTLFCIFCDQINCLWSFNKLLIKLNIIAQYLDALITLICVVLYLLSRSLPIKEFLIFLVFWLQPYKFTFYSVLVSLPNITFPNVPWPRFLTIDFTYFIIFDFFAHLKMI